MIFTTSGTVPVIPWSSRSDAFMILHQFHEFELTGQVERGGPVHISGRNICPQFYEKL